MNRTKHSAFTLVEMVLGISITIIIGLSVAGMSFALSSAYGDSQSYYTSIQNGRCAMINLQTVLRNVKLVTFSTPNSMMLWVTDTAGNGQINTNDLVYVTYNAATKELHWQKAVYPATFTDAQKLSYGLNVPLSWCTDPATTPGLFAARQYYADNVLASNVTAFSITPLGTAPQTDALEVKLTVGQGTGKMDLRTFVKFRSDYSSRVSQVGGQWVLN